MGKTKEKNKAGRVLLLPVDQIEASPYQARTSFDDTEIAALAVSILQNGLLQPVSVRRTGVHKYQLVAGERRLRACRLAKLEKVPAILAEFDDSESAALGLLENLQRAQLDPFDTARGIREVIRLWGCTQAEAARRLGLSQSALANKLRLLTLTADQQRLCAASHLSERHARAALRLPENRRTAALEKMARDGLSVREADKLVDAMLAAPKAGPSPVRRTVPMVRDVRFFVNTLQHAVDMMAQKGIPATATCGRRDGCLEYTVRIPVGEAAGPDAFAVVPVPLPHAGAPRTPHLPARAGRPGRDSRSPDGGGRGGGPCGVGCCGGSCGVHPGDTGGGSGDGSTRGGHVGGQYHPRPLARGPLPRRARSLGREHGHPRPHPLRRPALTAAPDNKTRPARVNKEKISVSGAGGCGVARKVTIPGKPASQ